MTSGDSWTPTRYSTGIAVYAKSVASEGLGQPGGLGWKNYRTSSEANGIKITQKFASPVYTCGSCCVAVSPSLLGFEIIKLRKFLHPAFTSSTVLFGGVSVWH